MVTPEDFVHKNDRQDNETEKSHNADPTKPKQAGQLNKPFQPHGGWGGFFEPFSVQGTLTEKPLPLDRVPEKP